MHHALTTHARKPSVELTNTHDTHRKAFSKGFQVLDNTPSLNTTFAACRQAPWLETTAQTRKRAHQTSGKAQSDGNVALAIRSRATPAVAEWVPAASRYRVVLQWRLDNCCGGEEGTAEASLNCKSPADRRRRRRH